MKFHLLLGAASAIALAATPVFAQDNTNVSGSASDANAVSGSQSGSSSDNFNVNAGGNNAGIGNSASNSDSNSNAVSGSISGSESNGNSQGQSANNTQGQGQDQGQGQTQNASSDQGQSQGQSANNTQGQTATGGSNTSSNRADQLAVNEQGVTVNQTWNSNQRRKTVQEFRTNAAVPLAASSSFSSDYCGGTASGGVSAAPIGISIGGAGPTFDKSCQSLRRAEKFGMLAANYHNLGQDEMALKAMSLMAWSICTADSRGTKADYDTARACEMSGMLGSDAQPPQNTYVAPQPPVTPEYTSPNNIQPVPEPERYKTPRGDLEFKSSPIIQDVPSAAAR